MDYTSVDIMKSYMDSQTTATATLDVLQWFVTTASRVMDRLCTSRMKADNYFMQEDVVGEVLTNGAIANGVLTVWPHKPITNSVTALSYRCRLIDPYTVAELTRISLEEEAVVFEGDLPYSEKVYAQISYNGGIGKELTDLPSDFVDLVTVLAVRGYKEARSGLGDAIGVAELGTMIYTKAFPVRVINSIDVSDYRRIARWT